MRLALILRLVSCGLGLSVEPVLISGWGPLPPLGVARAALALVGSQWIEFLAQAGVLLSGRARIHIDLRRLSAWAHEFSDTGGSTRNERPRAGLAGRKGLASRLKQRPTVAS